MGHEDARDWAALSYTLFLQQVRKIYFVDQIQKIIRLDQPPTSLNRSGTGRQADFDPVPLHRHARTVYKIRMPNVPKRVADRLVAGLKRFQPVLASAKSRDIGEADTVTIVTDMLADIFGFEKYSEITSEHAIRGTFCDLATKIDGQIKTLIEVKAIGSELRARLQTPNLSQSMTAER